MPANKELTLEREKRAWDLRLKFWSEIDIAKELGISQSAVSQMLKRVHARMRKDFQEGANEVFELQFNQLMIMAREALDAWHQSQLETKPVRPPARPVAQSENVPVQPDSEPSEPYTDQTAPQPIRSAGKPTYLRLTMQAMAAMRTLVEHGLVPALRIAQLKDRFLSAEQTQAPAEMKIPEGHRVNELGFVVPRISFDEFGELINMMTGRPATQEEALLYGV